MIPPKPPTANLRLARVRFSAARHGCQVEDSQSKARIAVLSNRDCTRSLVTVTGKISPLADGHRMTLQLKGHLGPRTVTILAGLRVIRAGSKR